MYRATRRSFQAFLGALAIVGTPSCDRQPESSVVGDNSLGTFTELVLSEERVVRIGGRDERPEYQIQYNSGALRLTDGRIVLSDDGLLDLRFYDPDGTHLRTVGGRGSGPGEFQRLRSGSFGRLAADTVYAWDLVQRRMSLFSRDGDLVQTLSIPILEKAQADLLLRYPGEPVSVWMIYPVNGGGLIVEPRRTPSVRMQTQITQDTLPLFLVDRDGGRSVEIGSFPGVEFFFHDGIGALLPLGENLRIAAGEGVAYVGSTRDSVIQIFSAATGGITGSITLPWEAKVTSEEDMKLLRARRRERRTLGGPDVQARMAAYAERIPYPGHMPIFSQLRVASDGRLWVQEYPALTDTLQAWHIFETSGKRVASLTLDSSAELLDAGRDYVVTRITGELDLQEVRVHHLEPPM